MIKESKRTVISLNMENPKTKEFGIFILKGQSWLSAGLITKDTFVRTHDILRDNLDTKNTLCIVNKGFSEEGKELVLSIVEFDQESDGEIYEIEYHAEEGKFYMLSMEESMFKAIDNAIKGEK